MVPVHNAVAGGAFFAKIPVDGYFPDESMQILPALVEAYNRSGNPGRFELHTMNHVSFDIVPSSDGPQTALLDTVMSFDATDGLSAPVTLRRFCEKLSRQRGRRNSQDGHRAKTSDGAPRTRESSESGDAQAGTGCRGVFGSADKTAGMG